MARQNRGTVKDEDVYKALREDGASKEKAARIANAKAAADKGKRAQPGRKGGHAAPYEEWSRDALYARAREIGIDGRSNMSKAQLIHALREH